jgi:CO/xanthine dehydrogenase Mo-binding subunit
MPKTELRVAGKGIPRHESLEKVTGAALYTDDIRLPGTVYGAILRSPHAHARVVSIDASDAKTTGGVLDILLPGDLPRVRFNCSGNPPSPLLIRDERVLTDHPLHLGDRIAAVVAKTQAAAHKALAALRVEYEVLPAVFDVASATSKNAPVLHPEISDTNLFKTIEAEEGDIETGFAQSDLVLEDTFETPGIHHVCMEPVACLCRYLPNDRLEVYCNTQTPFQDRRILARLLDLPESRVRVIKAMMGGGFGARQQTHNQPVAALLSRRTGRPVKIVNSREEEMIASCVRHAAVCRVKIGATNAGELRAIHAVVHHNAGAYATHSPIVLAAQSRKIQYRIPHYKYEGHAVYTNSPVAGAMRGYGNPQLTFAREIMIDRVARTLNVDPTEFRRKNHLSAGDRIPASPIILNSCAVPECIDEGERIQKRIDETVAAPKKTGDTVTAWGVAFAMHTSGPSNNTGMSSAVIIVQDDASAVLLTGSADMGQGSETALMQIVCEELGLGFDEVTITAADTQTTPYETGSFASSQAYVAGNAAFRAAADVREKVKAALCRSLSLPPSAIDVSSGGFEITGESGTAFLPFREAIEKITFDTPGQVTIGAASFKAENAPPPFAVCWARVVFDRVSKEIRVTHIIEAVDAGRPLNREIVAGQIEGGVAMGYGYAVMESVEYDRRADKPITGDILHYRIPTAVDVPKISAVIAKGEEPSGPLGAKSVGEMTTIPVAPAIANAIVAATGETITKLPLSRRFVFTHEDRR